MQIKSEYAISKNLGGIMVWAIDYEDHRNVCGGGAYPLLNTINRVLSGVSTDGLIYLFFTYDLKLYRNP